MRIRWRPLAEADLNEIVDFIAQDNVRAAIELGDTIERRIAELAKQPRLYRSGRVRRTREMVVHPHYVVVYRVKCEEIEIVRVPHTAQQWPRTLTSVSFQQRTWPRDARGDAFLNRVEK